MALAKVNFGFGKNYKKNAMSLTMMNKDLSTARVTMNEFNGKFIFPERVSHLVSYKFKKVKRNNFKISLIIKFNNSLKNL